MRFIFTGAQGTGKSSILYHYRDLGYNVITEVVRNLHKTKGINVNEMGDVEGQNMIFGTYKELLNGPEYISDRGLTDVCSYSFYHAKTKPEMVQVANEELKDIKEFVKNNPDVVFFYFPIEFDVVDDGFRSTDETFRHNIDELIHAILLECNIPYVEVRGTIEERIKIIDQYI